MLAIAANFPASRALAIADCNTIPAVLVLWFLLKPRCPDPVKSIDQENYCLTSMVTVYIILLAWMKQNLTIEMFYFKNNLQGVVIVWFMWYEWIPTILISTNEKTTPLNMLPNLDFDWFDFKRYFLSLSLMQHILKEKTEPK